MTPDAKAEVVDSLRARDGTEKTAKLVERHEGFEALRGGGREPSLAQVTVNRHSLPSKIRNGRR